VGRRAALIASIAALFGATPASAATYTVTGTGDPGGLCVETTCTTLRAAIAEAEKLPGTDLIHAPAGVINLADDYEITSQIQLVGASPRTTIIDGGRKHRAFRVAATGILQMGNVTVRNGSSGGGGLIDGGGIYNAGTMQLVNVRITGNRTQARGRGGGIANNRGTIVMDRVLIDDNVAETGGGGIHNVAGQEPTDRGWVSASNTTLFNNRSGGGGVGAIASSGTSANIQLIYATIADNSAGDGGIGGLLLSGTTKVTASIVARNVVGSDVVNCDPNLRPPTAATTSRTTRTAPSARAG
jgi:hypothetical protein